MNRSPQRHPADELADIREQLRELRAREGEVRQRLLDSKDYRGTRYRVTVRVQSREHLDVYAVKKHFGAAALKPFFKTVSAQTLRLHPADAFIRPGTSPWWRATSETPS
jgi:hypothetical protein